ncbi:MAG: WYL domain-containing transcriptional regulator [Actinobacteria bacterium]|nr:WYL domain-containing transcriptional regulator [Actinomycetota bacterium]
MTDRVERLVNLTATLLDTRRPLTLDDLAERLEPAYPSDKAAQRRAFERDKETLRDLGVPITIETIDALGGEQGYRIRPEDYYLPELALAAEERAALHVAVTAVRLFGGAGREGLRKLGGFEGTGAAPLAHLESTPALAELFDAVAKRRVVTFEYRGETRRLEPYGVVHRFGHWYVVGRDQDREAPRAFRVERIEGEPSAGDAGGFVPPPEVDPAEYLRADPMTYGEEEPVEAHVLVDATRAAWVIDELGDDAVVERRDDEAIVVALSVANRAAFRTWVLNLLEHAEVLEPLDLRAEMIEWLRDLVARAK